MTIKCSDKSKSMVVMSDEVYRMKAEKILLDSEHYEEENMTAEELEKRVCDQMKKTKSLGNLPVEVYKGLFPKGSRLPEFYGLPKVHKKDVPLRPVVAAFNGPLTPISILLERILHQLLPFVSAHIPNTVTAISHLEKVFPDRKVPSNAIIVTMDIVALYPSIPIADGIDAVVEKLKTHKEDINMLGISLGDIRSLLRFVLMNNYFTFGEKVYRQRAGVAMGNHLAPPLAIVFMDRMEQAMLESAIFKPETYDRYVDDCLMIWCHGEAELLRFMEHCNSQHRSIRFTWETSLERRPVSYMDTAIEINSHNFLEFELFQKPSDSGVNLNFQSCIPQHVKRSVATQQFHRARTLSSNPTLEERSMRKIKDLLRRNEFPESRIKKAEKASKEIVKRGKNDNETYVTLRLPFCSDGLDKKVRDLVRKSELPLRVRYNQAQNLKDRLVRSALSPKVKVCKVHEKFVEQQQRERKKRGKPRDDCISCKAGLDGGTCDIEGAVYCLKCNVCGEEYVGETRRVIRARVGEHHMQARNRCRETAWGEHMRKHQEIEIAKEPIFTARVLTIEKNNAKRKVREAIEIRDRQPKINRTRGWAIA